MKWRVTIPGVDKVFEAESEDGQPLKALVVATRATVWDETAWAELEAMGLAPKQP